MRRPHFGRIRFVVNDQCVGHGSSFSCESRRPHPWKHRGKAQFREGRKRGRAPGGGGSGPPCAHASARRQRSEAIMSDGTSNRLSLRGDALDKCGSALAFLQTGNRCRQGVAIRYLFSQPPARLARASACRCFAMARSSPRWPGRRPRRRTCARRSTRPRCRRAQTMPHSKPSPSPSRCARSCCTRWLSAPCSQLSRAWRAQGRVVCIPALPSPTACSAARPLEARVAGRRPGSMITR